MRLFILRLGLKKFLLPVQFLACALVVLDKFNSFFDTDPVYFCYIEKSLYFIVQ